MTTNSSDDRRVRASNAEREQCSAAIRASVSEGRLTEQEGQERLDGILAAQYRDELAPFIADLPSKDERPSAGDCPSWPFEWTRFKEHHALPLGLLALAVLGHCKRHRLARHGHCCRSGHHGSEACCRES